MLRHSGRLQATYQHSLEREQLLLRAVDEVEVSLACLPTRRTYPGNVAKSLVRLS